LDYISCWFYLGAKYIENTQAKYAYVSTNSICQGEQVGVLWPEILSRNLEINFGYTSFKWSNNAKYNAGVTCVIIGVSTKNNLKKKLFVNEKVLQANMINPYLTTGTSTIVVKQNRTPNGVPKLCFGAMP